MSQFDFISLPFIGMHFEFAGIAYTVTGYSLDRTEITCSFVSKDGEVVEQSYLREVVQAAIHAHAVSQVRLGDNQ